VLRKSILASSSFKVINIHEEVGIKMRYIYLDNFRGFQNAVIPILDVTFCVGENSSGKTSFLSAINLLSSSRFWFDQDFEGNETDFKHFDDYVSVNSSDRASFRMGVAEYVERSTQKDGSKGKGRMLRGFLFKYAENAGLPMLECYTAIMGEKVITVFLRGRDIKYRISNLGNATLDTFSKGLFDDWKAIQDDHSNESITTIRSAELKRGYLPPLYTLTLAYRHAAEQDRGRKPIGGPFLFPGPAFGGDTAWIAPIRTKPQRTYDEVRLAFSPEGTHMPYVIKKMAKRGKTSEKFLEFISRFGKESGLFKEIKVHPFGRAKTSPFELEIILDSKPLNISNVGYGVSQALPVVVEALIRPKGTLLAVQQPEVHLHPRAQASIGELLFVLAATEQKKFIVETHSDFTIDRFRMALRASKKKVESQVLFFARKAGRNSATSIEIEEDGELARTQPKAYREFFLSEEFKVIGL